MTNSELITKFITLSLSEKNLSSKTTKAYRCDLNQFNKIIGNKHFRDVDVEDLRFFLKALEKFNLADASIKRKMATLKVFYRFLHEEDITITNPTLQLRNKFKMPKRLPKVMSTVEIKKLLETAHSLVNDATKQSSSSFSIYRRHRNCVMLELLFSTGIRGEELISIKTSDIDLTTSSLMIHGKGRKDRVLYISSDEVVQTMTDYLRYRSLLNSSSTALFLNRFKQPFGVQSLRNVFQDYCKLAGITRHFTPHCLRHSMATLLLENGADVRSVQEILGHSRISTTEIYLEVSKRRKQEVLTRFNQRNFFHFR